VLGSGATAHAEAISRGARIGCSAQGGFCVILETVSLKRHPTMTEKWVQDQIAENPSLLGLGDLTLPSIELICEALGFVRLANRG
jgi:hypothetical protein